MEEVSLFKKYLATQQHPCDVISKSLEKHMVMYLTSNVSLSTMEERMRALFGHYDTIAKNMLDKDMIRHQVAMIQSTIIESDQNTSQMFKCLDMTNKMKTAPEVVLEKHFDIVTDLVRLSNQQLLPKEAFDRISQWIDLMIPHNEITLVNALSHIETIVDEIYEQLDSK